MRPHLPCPSRLCGSAALAAALLLLPVLGARADGTGEDIPGAVVGQSLGERPIQLLLVGLPGEQPLAARPRLLVVAGLDADHRAGREVALRLPAALRSRAKDDEELAALLRRFAVGVIPVVNPDGVDALLKGPDRALDTNSRPLDEDRDGATDEDGPDDLNGDGLITVMRVRDPRGTHRISDEDPRLLVPADPRKGERGEWRVFPEGLDSDGDGQIAEDPPGGVALDRNFAHGWVRYDRTAGTSAPSEPETRALAEHVLANPQISCVLVYGRHTNLTVVPKANSAGARETPNGPHADDLHWIRQVSERFREITGAESGPGDPADGAFHQWAYFQRGIPAFSTPLLHPGVLGEKLLLPSGKEPRSEEARWLALSDAVDGGSGFVPWEAYAHPTLGAVEIGGFAPGLRRRAPPEVLARLVDQQVRFVAALLAAMPRAAWRGAEATTLAAGVYELHAALSSEGVFPLVTAMGRTTRATAPIRVAIEAEVLQGPREMPLHRMAGTDRVRELRWVIRGKPGQSVRLRAVTEKGGTVDAHVTLP